MPQLRVVARALAIGASERFLESFTDRSLLIRRIDNVTVASVADQLRQTCDNIIVDAFLIADYGKQGLGRIQSTDQNSERSLS